jgi:hypothetical protein
VTVVRLLAAVAIAAALAGCSSSSEGGVTGTGLSAISGNVVAVSDGHPAQLDDGLPFAVRVRIAQFPAIAAVTDRDGTFSLAGEFSGALTLQFSNADTGAELGPLALEVPLGSQTILENVEIHVAAPVADRVQPGAVLQFDVFVRVDLVECRPDGTGTLLVTDLARRPRQYMAALVEDTDIVSADGAPLACAALRAGIRVRIAGLVRRGDQTLIASTVELTSQRPPPPNPERRPVRLRGIADAIACVRGFVQVEQNEATEATRRTIRLTDTTEFQCADEVAGPCDCSAIHVGTPLGISGTVLPQRPGVIEATTVVVGIGVVAVAVDGVITSLTCDEGLAVRVPPLNETLRIALPDDTEFRCVDAGPCRCSALRVRDRVHVEGHRRTDQRLVTAERISLLAGRDVAPR